MKKKIFIATAVLLVLTAIAGFVFLRGKSSDGDLDAASQKSDSSSEAVEAGKLLSGGKCEGSGWKKLGALPMDKESFTFLEPYGLMIGSHVTPIDHMYFEPADRDAPINTYDVYAPADGTITEIQRRETGGGVPGVEEEFRLVITYTCTFFSYYDLITVLDPEITEKAPDLAKSNFAKVEIPVKKGQVIGKIGKQTLDFAVWDTEKPLTGFVNPASYESEPWKIYTANPFDYFTDDVRKILVEKNLRAAEPIEGKIDYDIDGKLVGNWFREGTNGYAGSNKEKYWEGHTSFVYHYLDPTAIIVSIGDFNGESKQLAVRGNKPDPAKIGVESGVIKYELVDFELLEPGGGSWDRRSLVKNIKVKSSSQYHGIVLLQLIEARKLKMEVFPGKTASEVSGFTPKAKIYER